MSVHRLFQISLYLLVLLAGGMLAYAEEQFTPALAMPLVVAAAAVLTERENPFVLPVSAAGTLGLLAFGLAVGELAAGDIEARLLSGAHLVVYLTFIFLFMRKAEPQYWLLLALSLLMVALGAVLTDRAAYGMLLLLFLALGTWTLSVMSLQNASQRFDEAEAIGLRSELAEGEFGRQPRLTGRPSQSRGSVQQDPSSSWVNWRFVAGWFGSLVGIFILATLFYLFIPRFWIGNYQFADETIGPVETLTGFSPSVSLGEIGEILESTDPVMHVELFDGRNGDPLALENYARQLGFDEPLFRGTTLDTYSRGQWESNSGSDSVPRLPSRPNFLAGVVKQDIRLEAGTEEVLFAMATPFAGQLVEPEGPIGRDVRSGKLVRNRGLRARKAARYQLYSLKASRQRAGRPVYISPTGERRSPSDSRRYLDFPADRLPRIEALSRSVLTEAGVTDPTRDPRAAMIALEEYLGGSSQYGYTLQMGVEDPNIDPVEDFLFNRKVGHCEYFASALALMLRSVDIPSRLVSGFKGAAIAESEDEPRVVQKRHAHAWVEAWSEADDGWLILDPTPALARAESVESVQSQQSLWTSFKNFISGLWDGDIKNLSLSEQRRRYYEPIRDFVVSLWRAIRSGDWGKVRSLAAAVRDFVTDPSRWFSAQGGVVTFLLLTFLAATYLLIRKLYRLLRRLSGADRRLRERTQVAFYERFRSLCRTLGLQRRENQTHAEFARQVEQVLRSREETADDPEFAADVTRMYYRVRFGGEEPAVGELRAINERLAAVERKLTTQQTAAA